MVGELIYSCNVLGIRRLRSNIVDLTSINIRETKIQNSVWFICSKPNEYVMIFYQSTLPPPMGAQLWLRSHLTQNFFSFFNPTCQECLLFFRIAYLFKHLCLGLVRIIYFMTLPLLLKV